MIIKGKARSGPAALASHLGNAEKNERVELLETRGTIATDLRGALIEMDTYAAGSRCGRPLYHAAISPEPPHRLTPEQRKEAVDALEERLGFTGHARVVVLHEKLGREHVHVVWSRIDLENMRAVPDSHNYRKHEETSRDLERHFGHERVQGAHAERDGVARPNRTPSRSELRQEERTGITGKQVMQEVSAAFRASDGPEAFKAALAERGYQIAQGDRRDYVIVDRAGGIHSLARRIDGVKAAELRTYMAPLDGVSIPTIEQARTQLERPAAERRAAGDDDTRLAKAYGRGGDYVTQSRAAQKEHRERQELLDRRNDHDALWDRIDAGDDRRERERASAQAADDERPGSSPDEIGVRGDIEITDAIQARLDRLREAKAGYSSGPGAGRQNSAPGGGHTRSR
ncbi:MAG: Relaxase/mobilization nuclease family protein [Bradyrhizobium sp.]|nr:Relaxase/mobilization nuclease family protein [Bradyrhizobium sp.]